MIDRKDHVAMSQQLGEERRVVPFAVPPGRVRRRLIADRDGTGAVLLFTGVRYERAAEPGGQKVVPISPADPKREN